MDTGKLASYLSLAMTVLTGLATVLSPDIQAFWTSHPAVAATVGTVVAAVNLFLPQPHR